MTFLDRSPVPRPRPAFSLLEVLVASAILSMLMLGLGSAVLLARHAVPDEDAGAATVLAAGRALDRLAAELAYATSIVPPTSTASLTFDLDRDGDNGRVRITYAWSSTDRTLRRRAEDLDTQAVVETTAATRVTQFELQTVTRTADQKEGRLKSFESVANASERRINAHDCRAQYFQPSLPAGAFAWQATRVAVRLRTSGPTTGLVRAQLRPDNWSWPTAAVLEERPLPETDLSTGYRWVDIPFSRVFAQPNKGLCLIVKGLTDEYACELHRSTNAQVSNSRYYYSSDGGANWSVPNDYEMLYRVYGRALGATSEIYTSVRCCLRVGEATAAPGAGWPALQTTIRLVNEPLKSGT